MHLMNKWWVECYQLKIKQFREGSSSLSLSVFMLPWAWIAPDFNVLHNLMTRNISSQVVCPMIGQRNGSNWDQSLYLWALQLLMRKAHLEDFKGDTTRTWSQCGGDWKEGFCKAHRVWIWLQLQCSHGRQRAGPHFSEVIVSSARNWRTRRWKRRCG